MGMADYRYVATFDIMEQGKRKFIVLLVPGIYKNKVQGDPNPNAVEKAKQYIAKTHKQSEFLGVIEAKDADAARKEYQRILGQVYD
mgnify:CR=1 FL=1